MRLVTLERSSEVRRTLQSEFAAALLKNALAILLAAVCAAPAYAQAPPVGPLVLTLPSTPRTAALGNAWVAGRNPDVIFYNPAQLVGGGATTFDLSLQRFGPEATMATVSSGYAGGKWSLTLGWGVQYLKFRVNPDASYPYSQDALLTSGSASGSSTLVVVGGGILYKGFRIGAAGKFAADTITLAATPAGSRPASYSAFLADIGMSRSLFTGTAALSVQNLGGDAEDRSERIPLPQQVLAGWSTTRAAGPLDLGIYGQVTMRDEWTSPGAGVEVGYSWIDGYNVQLRAGVRRPEADTQRPFSFGAAFTADRLTVEYGVQFFEGGRAANGVTIRWR